MVAHCRERSAPHADTSARKLTVVSLCVCVYKRSACDSGKLWEIACESNSVTGSNCLLSLRCLQACRFSPHAELLESDGWQLIGIVSLFCLWKKKF